MIQLDFTKDFWKQYYKLPQKIQLQFDTRARLFVINQRDPRLRVHSLGGKYKGFWSMNVNGDVRALYQRKGDKVVIFGFIGTHSQLYG